MAVDNSLLLSMSALVSPIAMVCITITITRRFLLLLGAVSTRDFKAIVDYISSGKVAVIIIRIKILVTKINQTTRRLVLEACI